MEGAAGFDRQDRRINHVPRPAVGVAAIPDDGGRLRSFGDDEVFDAVPVNIENQSRRLLRARIRRFQIARRAAELSPNRARRTRDKVRDDRAIADHGNGLRIRRAGEVAAPSGKTLIGVRNRGQRDHLAARIGQQVRRTGNRPIPRNGNRQRLRIRGDGRNTAVLGHDRQGRVEEIVDRRRVGRIARSVEDEHTYR